MLLTDQSTTATRESDVVWGAAEIGREINRSQRQTFYLLERGLIPARKVGDIWQSTRAELRAAMRGEASPAKGEAA